MVQLCLSSLLKSSKKDLYYSAMLTKSAIQDFKKLGDRLNEDHLRAYVVSEIADNIHDPVAMNYALEEAAGDEQKTMAFYTKHRIRIIDDELKALGIIMAESQMLANADSKKKGKKSPPIIAQMFQNLLSTIMTIMLFIVLLFLLIWSLPFLI